MMCSCGGGQRLVAIAIELVYSEDIPRFEIGVRTLVERPVIKRQETPESSSNPQANIIYPQEIIMHKYKSNKNS